MLHPDQCQFNSSRARAGRNPKQIRMTKMKMTETGQSICLNPKSEYRNPKQILITEIPMTETKKVYGIPISKEKSEIRNRFNLETIELMNILGTILRKSE